MAIKHKDLALQYCQLIFMAAEMSNLMDDDQENMYLNNYIRDQINLILDLIHSFIYGLVQNN